METMENNQKSITVSELGGYIKNIFDHESFLFNIAVFGEVSDFSIVQGNAFFTIKDENAILSCVMFGANKLEYVPKVGESVIIRGTPRYYVKGGKINFNVVSIVASGLGALHQRFLELKASLEKEGLFDIKNKVAVPNNALNIGIATSITGAVVQDIIDIATRRNPSVNLYIANCKVQGVDAPDTIIGAIARLESMNLDVIIIARGGGSAEDLDCFNSEKLARFVATITTPIMSAIGHETDYTILDFVADMRAPTPSAAAELVVFDVSGQKNAILNYRKRIDVAIKKRLSTAFEKIQTLRQKSEFALSVKLQNYGTLIKNKMATFKKAIEKLFSFRENSLAMRMQVVEKLNPIYIMQKGFSKVRDKDKNPIVSINDVRLNDEVEMTFVDGSASAKIMATQKIKKVKDK